MSPEIKEVFAEIVGKERARLEEINQTRGRIRSEIGQLKEQDKQLEGGEKISQSRLKFLDEHPPPVAIKTPETRASLYQLAKALFDKLQDTEGDEERKKTHDQLMLSLEWIGDLSSQGIDPNEEIEVTSAPIRELTGEAMVPPAEKPEVPPQVAEQLTAPPVPEIKLIFTGNTRKSSREVSILGTKLYVSPQELPFLNLLVSNPETPVPKTSLAATLEKPISPNHILAIISRVREKIVPHRIVYKSGQGYAFYPEVVPPEPKIQPPAEVKKRTGRLKIKSGPKVREKVDAWWADREHLTPKERLAFTLLFIHPNELVTYDAFIAAGACKKREGAKEIIVRIRRKIGNPGLIVSVWGEGYKFAPPGTQAGP